MAKEVDPNSPIPNAMAEVAAQNILDSVRELQEGEALRAEPQPVVHFDWSVDDTRQEDVEHILYVLREAGYYTHPLPDVKEWQDKATWSKERAGVWRHEPDWHIVEFHDDGSKDLKEKVDIPLPDEWRPNADER